VHCVVTSPPYWGLRDYGTARWDGGDPDCLHQAPVDWITKSFNANSTLSGFNATQSAAGQKRWFMQDGSCRCGAQRIDSQIGLEPDYRDYVAALVAVFREVRRVLRADGTVWVNLGDSYAGGNMPGWRDGNELKNGGASNKNGVGYVAGLKPKDLVGIPWRVAFALQDDGWYLRQDIIWSKPNPMPESVTDRCTKAHEYLFLLSKSERYWFDAEAIAESSEYPNDKRRPLGSKGAWQLDGREQRANGGGVAYDHDTATRNKRSVWQVATAPYGEAHFATFPPALIEPCILAGCPEKCCAKCGAPWVRQTSRLDKGWDGSKYGERAVKASGGAITGGTAKSTLGSGNGKLTGSQQTVGWSPSCSCAATIQLASGETDTVTFPTIPGVVLDPFLGAGTTGLVADRLGRNCIGIELNPAYAAMAQRRIDDDAGMFADTWCEAAQ
jgi:DNA modification methylase